MRYGILGPLQVRDDGRDVPLGGARQRVVLALLLLHGNEALGTERLIEEIWSGAPPPSAAKVVHNAVSGLRKALGDGALITNGHGYVLRVADGELDLDRFQALVERGRESLAAGDAEAAAALLREGLALWRGEPLEDLRYEPALQDEEARLQELRLAAIEERVDADLELGRHHELVAELDELVARHPLRERLRAQQMLALYRSGRQADALEAYGAARRHLVAELGVEPGPALQRLHGAILAHDPALGAPTSLPAPARAVRPSRRPAAFMLAGAGLLVVALVLTGLVVRGGSGTSRAGLGTLSGESLVAIDPATNKLVAEVPVGATPTNVAVGAGAVWVLNADDQTISRVDARTDARKVFSTGALPIDLAAGRNALWVVNARRGHGATDDVISAPGSVARVEPLSGVTEASTPLPQPTHLTFALPPGRIIAVDDRAVWALGRPGTVNRLDLQTGRLRTLRSLDAQSIAVGDGQVWVQARGNRIDRLDPRTGRVVDRVTVPAGYLSAMAVGDGALWLTDPAAGTVWRIDARSLQARTIAVEPGVDSIALGDRSVWTANSVRGVVDRINPASNRVTARIATGGAPRGIAVGAGRVWVSVAGSGTNTGPAAGGLRAGARVAALPAPPCGAVTTGPGGDPDLLIAADLPMRKQLGTTLPMSQAVAFVLRQHHFRAGRFRLGLQSCDDATARYGTSDQTKCRGNAKAYAANPAVVGVVGPLNSDCAAPMLPILNLAPNGPVAVVSPTNGSPALVRGDPDAPGALRKLYPNGQRGYARVYPSDDYEAAAGALLAKRLGHGSVFYLEDRDFSAAGPWRAYFRAAAARIGLHLAGTATWRVAAHNYRQLAQQVRATHVKAVYLNTTPGANLREVLRDLRAALGPHVAIIGNSGFLPISSLFANVGNLARGIHITSPGLPLDRLDTTGRRFARAFGATQHARRVTNFDVYAAAATELLLDAIAHSDGTRLSVTRALATAHLADGPLGPLSVDRHGELTTNQITVIRADHAGGANDVLGLEGGITEQVIAPAAQLVHR